MPPLQSYSCKIYNALSSLNGLSAIPQNEQTHSNNSPAISVFDHFVGLALKGLTNFWKPLTKNSSLNYNEICLSLSLYITKNEKWRRKPEICFKFKHNLQKMSMEVFVLVIQTRRITNVRIVMFVLQTRLHVESQNILRINLTFKITIYFDENISQWVVQLVWLII